MPACQTVRKHDALGFNNSLFLYTEDNYIQLLLPVAFGNKKTLKETVCKILLITTQSERYHFAFMTIHLDGVNHD